MIPVEYCRPDSSWFESPATPPLSDVYGTDLVIPRPWRTTVGPDWSMVAHPDVALPAQGWKIHVSATPANAGQTLAVAAKYCLSETIPFKYLRAPDVLLRRNGKYGSRSGSGKFITIYPPADRLGDVLTELGGLLDGTDGPYVLTDVRWRSGPLYVRFGGIAPPVRRGVDGRQHHLIQDGTGRWIPDSRRPFFRVPDGVAVPGPVADAIADRDRATLVEFPYTIVRALHYSNGGGVYLATDDHTGASVLVREARPLAGVDLSGADAVDRLHAERTALVTLADVAAVPSLLDQRIGVEHHYLIREFVDGRTLESVAAEHRATRDADDHSSWVRATVHAIGDIVADVAAHDMTIGDLHTGNLLVDDAGDLHLIDLETASDDPDAGQVQAAIGYVAPPAYRGPRIDRWATGIAAISLFAPGLPSTLAWNSDADGVIADVIARRFTVDDADRRALSEALGSDRPTAVPTHVVVATPDVSSCVDVDGLARGILARADLSRTDRLFPADPAVDATPEGALSLAHGAAGVIGALSHTDCDTTEVTGWLVHRARATLDTPADELGWGLHNGLGGVLWTLLDPVVDTAGSTGAVDTGADLAAHLLSLDLTAQPWTGALFGGLAGIGLAALRAEKVLGTPQLLTMATDVLDRIRRAGPGAGPRRHGLMQGASGSAVFAAALGDRLGDTALLDLALTWIDLDLAVLGDRPPTPSLAGDLGVVFPLLQLLATAEAADPIRDRIEALVGRIRPHHIADGAGLLHGWAGTAAILDALARRGIGDADRLADVRDPDILRAYAVRDGAHVAVLGSANLRLSDDLATGTAGVVAALVSARDGVSPLPGLGPVREVSVP